MRKDNSHLAASGRWFQLYAGPQVPNPGPTPPILETTVPNDSINPTPSNIIISCPTTSTNIYRKVNAKTEFLSRMSHEIRTPMNAIIGMTAIALSALDNKERISDCLAKIGISARFLLSLINDILDMSRIESGRMNLAHEKFDFEEMINFHSKNGASA